MNINQTSRGLWGILCVLCLIFFSFRIIRTPGNVEKLTIKYSISNVKPNNKNLIVLDSSKTNDLILTDSFSVYYFEGYELYEINNRTTHQSAIQIDSVTNSFKYVLAKEKSDSCFWFDAIESTKFSETESYNSFIKHNALAGADLFDSTASTFIRRKSISPDEFICTYSYKTAADKKIPDTIEYFFKVGKNTRFSFSPSLEKKWGFQIQKVIFYINQPSFSDAAPVSKQTVFEMKHCSLISNEDKVRGFIQSNRKLFSRDH